MTSRLVEQVIGLRPRLALVVLLAAVCASCVDRGGAYVVDNQSDQQIVARVSGLLWHASPAPAHYEPRRDTFVVPPHMRLAVALVGFVDPFSLQRIEFLSSDCQIVGDFDEAKGVAFARDGSVIAVGPGPSARLVKDFPETATLAQRTDQCVADSAYSRLLV
jgi:hypothetical protein